MNDEEVDGNGKWRYYEENDDEATLCFAGGREREKNAGSFP